MGQIVGRVDVDRAKELIDNIMKYTNKEINSHLESFSVKKYVDTDSLIKLHKKLLDVYTLSYKIIEKASINVTNPAIRTDIKIDNMPLLNSLNEYITQLDKEIKLLNNSDSTDNKLLDGIKERMTIRYKSFLDVKNKTPFR